jgi:hypothetical protein
MPGTLNRRWLAHAAALLAVLALLVAARTAHADDLGALAAEAGVDPVDLAGAVNTTGMDARSYLCMTGELPCYVVVFDTGVQEQPDGTAISAIQVRRVGTVADIIHDRAAAHGVSGAWLLRVARCESNLNPRAVGRAGELGLMQLHPRGLLPLFYRMGYRDPFNAWESADFSARMFARGLSYHWTCAR